MKKVILGVLLLAGVAVLFSFANTSLVQASQPDTVRVWVEFEQGHKANVRGALNRVGAKFHYEFDDLNSFVVTVPGNALNGIRNNPHVVDVEEDAPRYLIESKPVILDDIQDPYNGDQIIPYGVDMVQARELWDSDFDGVIDDDAPTGEGITVCIIDTGFYSAHEDLTDINLTGGISQVDDDYQTDGYGHGSHVAGTISAVNNALGVVGVTPGTVNFYIVKYFANDGLFVAGASDLVAAINDCADHGANVINMSLGGSSSNRKEQRAFDNLYADGVLSIAAAGNEDSDDPHYPSSYSSVVSVSAVDEDGVKADFSNYGEDVELAAPGVDVLSTIPYIETNFVTVDGVPYDASQIEFAGLGSASGVLVDGGLCGTTGSWSGAVVLCERGDFSFAEKILNVQSGGGVAAVLYNNEPGNFLGTMDPDSSTILGVSISQEDGQYLVANKLGTVADVYSALEKPASGYEAWGGTSMATPHVSGVAALIWSGNPSLTNVEIREAMNATAMDLGDTGWDPIFGNGLVQAADAYAYLGGGPVDNDPVVTITAPVDGSTFDSGAAVTFAGTADDIEDGDLSADLVWTSNLDGTIGSGASFSAVLSDGTHTITAAVVDSASNPGSDAITVVVGGGQQTGQLVVGVSTDQAAYSHGDTAVITVTVNDEYGAPVDGAAVEVTISTPKNKTSRLSATTSDGVATLSYNIHTRRNGSGTYTVDVTASKDGYDAGSASTTFVAQ